MDSQANGDPKWVADVAAMVLGSLDLRLVEQLKVIQGGSPHHRHGRIRASWWRLASMDPWSRGTKVWQDRFFVEIRCVRCSLCRVSSTMRCLRFRATQCFQPRSPRLSQLLMGNCTCYMCTLLRRNTNSFVFRPHKMVTYIHGDPSNIERHAKRSVVFFMGQQDLGMGRYQANNLVSLKSLAAMTGCLNSGDLLGNRLDH